MVVWKIADRYTNGIPDAYYGGEEGRSLWIEYKLLKRTTDPQTLDISPAHSKTGRLSTKQQDWLNCHHKMGHSVAAVVMHYRPRNTTYYVFLNGQWNTQQHTNVLLQMNQGEFVKWVSKQVGMQWGNQ